MQEKTIITISRQYGSDPWLYRKERPEMTGYIRAGGQRNRKLPCPPVFLLCFRAGVL